MRAPDPAADLALLEEAALAAGKIATAFFHGEAEVWHKPGDAGPVTEADLAVDSMLRSTLIAARPAYGWLSEETPDTQARLSCRDVFIVDPIDGTRAFVAQERNWSHSLATARDGEITAAVVYLPLSGKLYAASRGGGAFLNGAPIRAASRPGPGAANVLANKWTMQPRYWPRGVPPFKRHFRSSLAYRLALVGEGRFDAMITFRDTWEWDVAAGTLIATEAGAEISNRHGAKLRFNSTAAATAGVVAGAPALRSEIIAMTRN